MEYVHSHRQAKSSINTEKDKHGFFAGTPARRRNLRIRRRVFDLCCENGRVEPTLRLMTWGSQATMNIDTFLEKHNVVFGFGHGCVGTRHQRPRMATLD